MLKLPYAVRDFNKLITEGHFYFDRTDRIAILENLGYELLFLRPRRFGKSLWLSTLMNYYDVAKAADFERLFGNLAVGQKPTPLHNQYLVMKWDFSGVESQGDIHEIRQSLYNHINVQIKNFQRFYREYLSDTVEVNPDDALYSLNSLLGVLATSSHKLYLFIDEYDNFANEVMMGQQRDHRKRYDDLVSGEGLLKTLFKNIKIAGSGGGLDRLFMTGVSPILMNDVTSGANVNEDVTWLPYFRDLCGFRASEVYSLVEQMVAEGQLAQTKVAEVMEQMRIFYNGSQFVTHAPATFPDKGGQDSSLVYNPILVFYFLRNIQRFGYYPDNMLDNNLTPDYNKLVYISSHPKGEELIYDALNEEASITVFDVSERWGVKEMLDPDKQRERLATLLCYLGALTVAGKTVDGEILLKVPNLVMRKLYAERMLKMTFTTADELDEAYDAARQLFAQGNLEPLCTFAERHLLSVYDNRDYRSFNELTLKTLFIALLHYNNLYMMDSEPALLRNYGDLIMIIRPEMRHYSVFDLLLEFKYVPLSKVSKATQQELRVKSPSELAELSAVKQERAAAKRQLLGYWQTLAQKYGAALKLRTYAVVAVGVERLVWEEITS
ncbi:MAG: AAA family ATPase [Caldilineaceae bacterium]